jgi:hypothetical protein
MMTKLEKDKFWQGAEDAQEKVLVDLVRNRAGHADVGERTANQHVIGGGGMRYWCDFYSYCRLLYDASEAL